MTATCDFDNLNSTAKGIVTLTQEKGRPLVVTGDLTGVVRPGKHGFHVHERGDILGENGCKAAEKHFNPENMSHAGPNSEIKHHGDMGNISINKDGKVTINKINKIAKISGDKSLIGHVLVIHENEDDLGLATGNK